MSKITMTAKYAVEVQPFQSTEKTRRCLNGFYATPNPSGGLRIVATDGHRLVCFHDAHGRLEGDGLIVQLSKQALAAVKGAMRDNRLLAESDIVLIIDDETNPKGSLQIRIGGAEGRLVASFADVIVDGTFPDYERVIPGDYQTTRERRTLEPGHGPVTLDKTAPLSFNVNYLASFGTLGGKTPMLEMVRTTDHESPHLVFVGGRHDVFGVLMPVRGNGVNAGRPSWFTAPAPKAVKPAVAPKLAVVNEAELATLGS